MSLGIMDIIMSIIMSFSACRIENSRSCLKGKLSFPECGRESGWKGRASRLLLLPLVLKGNSLVERTQDGDPVDPPSDLRSATCQLGDRRIMETLSSSLVNLGQQIL